MLKILLFLFLGYLLFRVVTKPALPENSKKEKEIEENTDFTDFEEID